MQYQKELVPRDQKPVFTGGEVPGFDLLYTTMPGGNVRRYDESQGVVMKWMEGIQKGQVSFIPLASSRGNLYGRVLDSLVCPIWNYKIWVVIEDEFDPTKYQVVPYPSSKHDDFAVFSFRVVMTGNADTKLVWSKRDVEEEECKQILTSR